MISDFRFHHVGVAVRRPDEALRFARALDYACSEALYDPLQKVNLIFCTHPAQPALEIIYGGPEAGPLDGILKDRPGIAYHVCYEVDGSVAAVAALEQAGLRAMPVSPVKPAVLFPGQAVSFWQVIGFGLVELVEPWSSATN